MGQYFAAQSCNKFHFVPNRIVIGLTPAPDSVLLINDFAKLR